MKQACIFLFLWLLCMGVFAQNNPKQASAVRVSAAPKIDGVISESQWNDAPPIIGFTQFQPFYNVPPTQKTEVRIIYDNNAIYIAAKMFDTAPDSILKQLGNRDDGTLNAEQFGVIFDTYNTQQDAYSFSVYSSGVQSDSRVADGTYDAVWQSAVKINKDGWSCEFRIPYSALRFPKTDVQTWGMQIFRGTRRHRERDEWALLVKGTSNDLVYFGKLNGIKDIQLPLRLSFTPYFTLYGEHFPYNIEGKSNFSKSFSGGMDVKYGINESFTIDMTLLPDFSQVQSDNLIKNLSAFETVFAEQRPFFKEAVDLFQKGGLFYSRRIGRTPMNYYPVFDQLHAGEFIKTNPTAAKLLNATKFSGRNKNGLAMGVFNAITNCTYAIIEDSTGKTRDYLTEPFTNYNIIVLDQALFNNNSSVYLVNTNVNRDKGFNDANVTAGGVTLIDKSNTFSIGLSGGLSQKYTSADSTHGFPKENSGLKYGISFSKIKGAVHFGLSRSFMNDHWDINDMGVNFYNNEVTHSASIKHSVYEPFWIIRAVNNTVSISHSTNYTTKKPTGVACSYALRGTFLNYLSFWAGIGQALQKYYDYYEPRIPGRYYISPFYTSTYAGVSSDYRKPFALDAEYYYTKTYTEGSFRQELRVGPRIRVSNKLMLIPTLNMSGNNNNAGYATVIDSTSQIIFGKRDISTTVTGITGQFIFKNDLSLSLSLRHYWSKGKYKDFYTLEETGNLSPNQSYAGNHNFNFNTFNIDLMFSWQFSPGSTISIVWKNAILQEENILFNNYYHNLEHTFDSPQLNSLSLKVLYYLDYNQLKKKNRS